MNGRKGPTTIGGRIGDERAQGVVEFAFIITILALLFMGTLDFARFMYYDVSITSAARVGAEAASNHCAYANSNCALNPAATSDAIVQWSTYCEAASAAVLVPTFSSCSAGTSTTWTPTCTSTSCTNCATDICVSPSTRTTGTQVTVSVGYSFKPYTLFMAPFFPDKTCFTGDSSSTNHHTVCANATGRVS